VSDEEMKDENLTFGSGSKVAKAELIANLFFETEEKKFTVHTTS